MNVLAVLISGIMINAGNGREALSKLTISKKGKAAVSTYQGGNYCGPGWGFTYRDILDGKIQKMPQAVDAIDEACKAHDYCYQENGYLTQGCNLVLTYDLVNVVVDDKSTAQQRLDAVIMAAVFFVESQLVDVPVLIGREAKEIADRIRIQVVNAGATLQSAIKRELNMRGAGIP